MPVIIETVAELRRHLRPWRDAADMIGIVPTMGALHEGHVSLIHRAFHECAHVVTSIFVNPRQFDNDVDLEKYPRSHDEDIVLASEAGSDVIFMPSLQEVYPDGFASFVSVGGIADRLEGRHRPGHFNGVATIVTKLFGMSGADRAYFGEKDWQQLQVVGQLVRDLDLPIEIIGCGIVRAPDGLALSSRNTRLSPDARAVAPSLYQTISRAADAVRQNADAAETLDAARAQLLGAGFERIDYLDLCDAETLAAPEAGRPRRLLAAAWLDDVRLIDNLPV